VPAASDFGEASLASRYRRFLAVGEMDSHAAGSSSAGGSGDGGATRRHSRKPKCEISHHRIILLMLPLPLFWLEMKYFRLLLFSFRLGWGSVFSFGYFRARYVTGFFFLVGFFFLLLIRIVDL
jgi:hypothetical protein